MLRSGRYPGTLKEYLPCSERRRNVAPTAHDSYSRKSAAAVEGDSCLLKFTAAADAAATAAVCFWGKETHVRRGLGRRLALF